MLIKKMLVPVVIAAGSLGAVAMSSIALANPQYSPNGYAVNGALPVYGHGTSATHPNRAHGTHGTSQPHVQVRPTHAPQHSQTYTHNAPTPRHVPQHLPQYGHGNHVNHAAPVYGHGHGNRVAHTQSGYGHRTHVSHSSYGHIAHYAPPALRHEYVPHARRGFVWVPGYWDFSGYEYFWVDGYFAVEQRGYSFHQQRWEQRGNSWFLQPARWDRDGDGVPNYRDSQPNNPFRR